METRERVRELLSQGYTPRDIAKALNITTQAVYLHMQALRAISEKPA